MYPVHNIKKWGQGQPQQYFTAVYTVREMDTGDKERFT